MGWDGMECNLAFGEIAILRIGWDTSPKNQAGIDRIVLEKPTED